MQTLHQEPTEIAGTTFLWKMESGLVDERVIFIIGRVPAQTPLGFGTQPHYEVPGDLWIGTFTVESSKFLRSLGDVINQILSILHRCKAMT